MIWKPLPRLSTRQRGDSLSGLATTPACEEQAAEAHDDAAFLALDKAFNELVGRTCRNPFARASMEQWNPLARRFWYQHHQQVGDLSRMAALHADIAWAIGAGDEAAAGEACDLLMNYLTGFTRAALDAEHA